MDSMKARLTTGVLALLFAAAPARAFADLTAFIGVNPTPSNRVASGFALGMGLVIVGFEIEYASTAEDELVAAPSLRTGMFNVLLQTPFAVSGVQVYGTVGGGLYREALGEAHRETHLGTNVGGGVKLTLAGPLRLRLDYRVFLLRGEPLHERPQRFYAGLNLAF